MSQEEKEERGKSLARLVDKYYEMEFETESLIEIPLFSKVVIGLTVKLLLKKYSLRKTLEIIEQSIDHGKRLYGENGEYQKEGIKE